jgi:hypothetical protein
MAALSDYLENALYNHVLRNTAYTSPTTVYVALFTSSTGLETNNPTGEVTGGSYARVAVTMGAPTGGAGSNSGEVLFTQATANWGTVTHFAIVDHATNTTWGTNVNVLLHGALTAQKTINDTDIFRFPIGDIDIAFL